MPEVPPKTLLIDRSRPVLPHNICGFCVPRRRCPVVPLSLRLKRESEQQAFPCVLTQGIPHKLIAIDKFLQKNPEMASSIQLIQICTPPRGDTARYQASLCIVYICVYLCIHTFGLTQKGLTRNYIDTDIDRDNPEMASSIQLIQICTPPRGDTARYQARHNLYVYIRIAICITIYLFIFVSVYLFLFIYLSIYSYLSISIHLMHAAARRHRALPGTLYIHIYMYRYLVSVCISVYIYIIYIETDRWSWSDLN